MKSIRETFFLLLLFSTLAFGATTTSKQIDTINASGGASLSVPSSGVSLISDTGSATLTNKTINGSNNTISNVSLTSAVTGTLPVGNGGTGVTNPTSGSVLVGNGSSALSLVAAGTSGNVLTSNGSTWVSQAASGGGTWTQEFSSPACNGSTTVFTLANTPTSNAVVQAHLDGSLLTQGSGNDYTISSATLTLASACATGQKLYIVYTH